MRLQVPGGSYNWSACLDQLRTRGTPADSPQHEQTLSMVLAAPASTSGDVYAGLSVAKLKLELAARDHRIKVLKGLLRKSQKGRCKLRMVLSKLKAKVKADLALAKDSADVRGSKKSGSRHGVGIVWPLDVACRTVQRRVLAWP